MVHPYRSRNLAELAQQLNFSFSEEDDYGLLPQLRDFQLFSEGRNRSIKRVLRHQHGLMDFDIAIFDYSYTRWSGSKSNKDKQIYQTVFFVQSQQLGLPEMYLQPETLLHKLGELLGFKDIDFVRFPKFSGQYRLTGGDEEYIRHHFTDEVLNYFTVNKEWSVEGLGFYLLFYRKGWLIPSAEIERFYRRGREVFGLLGE
ncbi:hypothetical protein [Neolewinella antarctica]|uniref:Uncharacterized protein n=1 Tax=Neolewinella antarctica TaxID=442734 RepID=A0ABX0X8I6_9BACT|nr:hypothetical protein [Neolewinella antarctica]NJC25555.1 hypothetical protein [Neolewinella antarctica]